KGMPCSGLNVSLTAYNGLVPMSPYTTPRASRVSAALDCRCCESALNIVACCREAEILYRTAQNAMCRWYGSMHPKSRMPPAYGDMRTGERGSRRAGTGSVGQI